ncbi:MAG: 2-C-methyl-D-erythritol 4-phosphate cytidylyltransferase [Mucinivorans sp.]
MNNLSTIIVAGGQGTRMGTETPKQFLLLDGEPILMHTIRNIDHALQKINSMDVNNSIVEQLVVNSSKHVDKIVNNFIVVLPKGEIERWRTLCLEYKFTIAHTVVAGGESRWQSVKKGLATVDKQCRWVAVHDGVRPFVEAEMLLRLLLKVRQNRAAIAVMPLTDSIRNEQGSQDRSLYKSVQTPQIFDYDLLLKGYQQPYDPKFTDDSSTVEALGQVVATVEGEGMNIKITSPIDLALAHIIIKSYF